MSESILTGSTVRVESAGVASARVWVDGQEVRHLRDIQITIGLDALPTLRLELLAERDVVFDGRADVQVMIVALDGTVTAEPQPDGERSTWWSEDRPRRSR